MYLGNFGKSLSLKEARDPGDRPRVQQPGLASAFIIAPVGGRVDDDPSRPSKMTRNDRACGAVGTEQEARRRPFQCRSSGKDFRKRWWRLPANFHKLPVNSKCR